ncbi:MAG: sigma-70 family RNA polymerase sigma factor, partial [Candidatus Cloacimonadota bacterium]|nr:sigma-70 family RNA polymerase sigma factor [Candidatus Cloacimonadota bacterium]
MNNKEFEKVVRKYQKKIFNYLLKFHKHKEDAEDILQATFIDFFRYSKKTTIKHHSAFLYRTAHNKSINLKKKNAKITTLNTENYSEIDNSKNEENHPKNQEIRKALSSLSPKYLLTVELKYYQKKNYKEIAEIMEITESAVESILVRARRQIKKNMQDFENRNVLKIRKEK